MIIATTRMRVFKSLTTGLEKTLAIFGCNRIRLIISYVKYRTYVVICLFYILLLVHLCTPVVFDNAVNLQVNQTIQLTIAVNLQEIGF
jgi:hypothetical protein